jgi:proline iminopeptidase
MNRIGILPSLVLLPAVIVVVVALPACRGTSPSRSPESAALRVEEGFFPGANGIKLFYRKVGTGSATAVYLHGGPADMSDGGYELDALAQGRTLIAFDQRSGGRSELVNDPTRLTVEYYIRDLEALQRHFRLKRMTLIGQSWGAMLAAMYTTRHPESVERLLLLSPGSPSSAFAAQRFKKTNAVIGEAGAARIAELEREIASAPDDRVSELCRERIRLIFRAYVNDVSALERMRVHYWDAPPAALRHELLASDAAFDSLGSFDFLPDLAKLKQPALVVEGADTQVPLEATRAWAAALPNGRLLLVPGACHIVWLEGDVPMLMRALNQFLAGGWPEKAETVLR